MPSLFKSDQTIGLVGGNAKIVSVTPTLDTNAYSAADHLGSLQTLSGALRQKKGTGLNNSAVLQSIVVLDKDDQGAAFDIVLFNASPTIASADNAAFSITDAEAEKIIGVISVATTDYSDLGGNRIATVKNIGLLIEEDVTDLYAVLVSRGTPTYTAAGLILNYGFLQD